MNAISKKFSTILSVIALYGTLQNCFPYYNCKASAEENYYLGDINQDGAVNASDASDILVEAALRGIGLVSEFSAEQESAADLNKDGKIDASDASYVLSYAAEAGSGFSLTVNEFMQLQMFQVPTEEIPAYSDSPYYVLNNNIPFFDTENYTVNSFEYYSELDSLGRC
ncbi:MAG: dockerin type I repeat-containing protein, partial [Allobaculum sp.]|nr:dockerin type I repeat-containing protein [Allobaculum sp.]